MSRSSTPYAYTVETLVKLSGWPRNRIDQDVRRKDLRLGKVEEAAVWLAANGNPELRARMARKLLPVVLGTKERRPQDSAALAEIIGLDLLETIFDLDAGKRKRRA